MFPARQPPPLHPTCPLEGRKTPEVEQGTSTQVWQMLSLVPPLLYGAFSLLCGVSNHLPLPNQPPLGLSSTAAPSLIPCTCSSFTWERTVALLLLCLVLPGLGDVEAKLEAALIGTAGTLLQETGLSPPLHPTQPPPPICTHLLAGVGDGSQPVDVQQPLQLLAQCA